MSSDLFCLLLECAHSELLEFLKQLKDKPFNFNTVGDLVDILGKFPGKILTERVMACLQTTLKGSLECKTNLMIALALSSYAVGKCIPKAVDWESAVWKSLEESGLDSEYLRPLPSTPPPAMPLALPPALPSTLPPALPSTLPPALPSTPPPALLVEQNPFARALLNLLNAIPGSYAIKIDVVREWLREVLSNSETYRVPDLGISAWDATLRAYVFGDGDLPQILKWSVSNAERVFAFVHHFRALRNAIAVNTNCSDIDLFVFAALGMRLN